jgi:hypothetical protein
MNNMALNTSPKATPPPVLLVKTWFQIMCSQEDPEAISHAKKMIERNFGSVDLAQLYLEHYQLK